MQTIFLSKTRLNTYAICPQKYKYTYVDNIVHKTPVALIEGSALHHIVENCLVYGKVIPNLVEDVAAEYWQSVNLDDTEYADEIALEEAKNKILAEAKAFMPLIGEVNSHQMETFMEQNLVNPETGEIHEDILIRGYADLIDSPKKDMLRIIDIKTTAKTPSAENANRALELSVYAYLAACNYGFHCEFPVAFLYLVRTKTPKIVWQNSLRVLSDYINIYEMMLNVANAIRYNIYYRNVGLQCSWCVHQNICFANANSETEVEVCNG